MDPRSFNTNEEFIRAYNVAWGFSQAADQILGFIDQMIEEAEGLTKKEQGEIKDKLKEGLS